MLTGYLHALLCRPNRGEAWFTVDQGQLAERPSCAVLEDFLLDPCRDPANTQLEIVFRARPEQILVSPCSIYNEK